MTCRVPEGWDVVGDFRITAGAVWGMIWIIRTPIKPDFFFICIGNRCPPFPNHGCPNKEPKFCGRIGNHVIAQRDRDMPLAHDTSRNDWRVERGLCYEAGVVKRICCWWWYSCQCYRVSSFCRSIFPLRLQTLLPTSCVPTSGVPLARFARSCPPVKVSSERAAGGKADEEDCVWRRGW